MHKCVLLLGESDDEKKLAKSCLLLALVIRNVSAASDQPSPVDTNTLGQRSVVPIHEVLIGPKMVPRYTINVIVNGQPLQAGLDTGSTGLRLLPRAVAQAGISSSGIDATYGYGSGVTLIGPNTLASVEIGSSKKEILLQAVRMTGCRGGGNDCPAGKLTPSQYGLMGSGFPNQGFSAIIGIRFGSKLAPNPLVKLGVESWIVHIPQRGKGDGFLVLNPDSRDTKDFVPLLSKSQPTGSVDGCIKVARLEAQEICSAILWDTGAPAITVRNAQRPRAWQPGAPIEMLFTTASGAPLPPIEFRAGDPERRGRANFSSAPNRPGLQVSAGLLPYYSYDMFYNAKTGGMAVRANTGNHSFTSAR